MAGSETCTEYLVTAEKRRISPPENSPNTKRRISPPSNPSLITQLVDDPAILGMAQNLAGDLDFVQMAKELLSSLQCAGAEHLVSLPIWHNQHNQQLLKTLQQYQPLLTMKETSPLDDQHIVERMARIKDHPSLKCLLGEKEDLYMIRGALIILFAYWIDFDNEDETMEDVLSSEDESEEDKTCLGSAEETSDSEMCSESLITAEKRKLSLEESETPDDSLIARLVNDPGLISLACNLARNMGFVQMADKLFTLSEECDAARHLLSLPIMQNKQFLKALEEKMEGFIDLNESIIFDLVDHPCIEKIACEIESGSGLAIILDELLKSVVQPCASTSLHEDCTKHFNIVNMAWEDNQLICSLLKQERSFFKIGRYSQESSEQLCEKLTPYIKANSAMDNLFENKASRVRGALTILIGYFSAKNKIPGFDDVMGRGGAVGIKTVRYTYGSDATTVERTSSERRAFMDPSSTCTLDVLMPDASLLCQLYHDASFMDLSQQIQSDPSAANLADIISDCFSPFPEEQHFIRSNNPSIMLRFGQHPSSIHLRRALKKCPSLFELFKKLSDGAEMLRLKERLDRIRGDGFLKTFDYDKSDFSLKMRLALSILIGYWSAGDVTRFVKHLIFYELNRPSNATQLEDLSDVEYICFWADSNLDLEGLKKVLASKYIKGSREFELRVAQIEQLMKSKMSEALDKGYDNMDAEVSAIFKGDSCIWIYFLWFTEESGSLYSAT